MSFIKTALKLLLISSLAVALAACEKTTDTKTFKVGTIAGPETDLMIAAQQVAQKENGLNIKIVPFTDYAIPNEALADGSIDANVFQHTPYLKAAIDKRHYKIIAVGKTFIYPMGLYSSKIKHLDKLRVGATIAIPNDSSNEARALLLLQAAGLITLNKNNSTLVTPADIIKNPKKLKIKEIDASQLPRTLPDVDLAAINTNYAMIAGLLPSRDALFIESSDSPYANLIVVRQGSEKDERVQQLVKALRSDNVLQKANELFKGQAILVGK